MARLRSAALLGMVSVLAAAGCLGAPPPGPSPPLEHYPDAGADAAPDAQAEPITRCCELDSARGERLDFKCGVAIDTGWLEARGYRCWLVQ